VVRPSAEPGRKRKEMKRMRRRTKLRDEVKADDKAGR
jgi:hypothetical protein